MLQIKEVAEKKLTTDNSIDIILFLVNSMDFNISYPSYNLSIYGKKMLDCVVDATKGYNTKRVILPDESDIINYTRSNLSSSKYTVILFSDTPLISRNALEKMIDYVYLKGLDCINFGRAYVGLTEYFLKNNFLESTSSNICEKELFRVYNFVTLEYARRVFDNMIKRYHMSNGVDIVDPSMTHIDGDCEIGQGTTLVGFNEILGSSTIGSNCMIENSTILDCEILDDVNLSFVKLKNCKVNAGAVVPTFGNFENKEF